MPRKRGEIKPWEYSLIFELLGKLFLFHVCDFKCLLWAVSRFLMYFSRDLLTLRCPSSTLLLTLLFSWPIAFGISFSFIFFWRLLYMILLTFHVECIDRGGKISLALWLCTCLTGMHLSSYLFHRMCVVWYTKKMTSWCL